METTYEGQRDPLTVEVCRCKAETMRHEETNEKFLIAPVQAAVTNKKAHEDKDCGKRWVPKEETDMDIRQIIGCDPPDLNARRTKTRSV